MSSVSSFRKSLAIIRQISLSYVPFYILLILGLLAFLGELTLFGGISYLLSNTINSQSTTSFVSKTLSLLPHNILILVVIISCIVRMVVSFGTIKLTHHLGVLLGNSIIKRRFKFFDTQFSFSKLSTDEFITVIANHCQAFVATLQNISSAFIAILSLSSILVIIFLGQSPTTIFSLVLISLFYILTARAVASPLKNASLKVAKNQVELVRASNEGLSLSQVLIVGNRLDFVTNRMNLVQRDLMQSISNAAFITGLPRLIVEMFIFILLAVSLSSSQSGGFSLAFLPLTILTLIRALPGFQTIYSAQSTLRVFKDSIDVLYKYLCIENPPTRLPTFQVDLHSNNVVNLIPSIYIDNNKVDSQIYLEFSDTNRSNSVRSYNIDRHSPLLICGPSGTGKTTFLQTLIKQLIDYRASLSDNTTFKCEYLPQKSFFISSSILANLQQGNSSSDIELISSLLLELKLIDSLSESTDFLSQLIGGDSKIKLSGGQEQRLALIRTIISKPFLVFADEFTSALDSQLELISFELLRAYVPYVICISHSPQLQRKCHNVLEFPIN